VALASAIVFKLAVGGVTGFALGTLLLAIAVVSIDYSAPVFRGFFEFGILRGLGFLSYSLYLWQQPFYKLHRASEFSLPTLLMMLILATCCSYYLVERPARRYINQYFARL
jgi:peptidoglycan/LPS O-acetylase OafA/YrhL